MARQIAAQAQRAVHSAFHDDDNESQDRWDVVDDEGRVVGIAMTRLPIDWPSVRLGRATVVAAMSRFASINRMGITQRAGHLRSAETEPKAGGRVLKEREVPMAFKPSAAKITDFETTFDVAPVTGLDGEVLWADVRIDYILSGFFPRVTIRVPIPWLPYETTDQRRSKALRCARELIDHACRASGIGPQVPEAADTTMTDLIESAMPSIVEGVSQELGLSAPTTWPKQKRREN